MVYKYLLALCLFCIVTPSAQAVSPPKLPLPECKVVDGVETGACPVESDYFSVVATGEFSAHETVVVEQVGSLSACNSWSIPSDTWSPSPCYSGVNIHTAGCYYIDLRDNIFKESRCGEALYLDISPIPANFITHESNVYYGPSTSTPISSCKHSGDFSTYFLGGPASDPEWLWSSRGPAASKCNITINYDRPDGLYGPTWMLVWAVVDRQGSGLGDKTIEYGETFVRVDGDLRDFGPVALFNEEVFGREVRFNNESIHPADESLNYEWDFGDGNSSTATHPVHVYESGGEYTVSLIARDPDGDEDSTTGFIAVAEQLVVILDKPFREPEVDEEAIIPATLYNYESSDISNLSLTIDLDDKHLKLINGPTPSLLYKLPKNKSTQVYYIIKAVRSGLTEIVATAEGSLEEGMIVTGNDSTSLTVPAQITLELSTSVVSETKVGDEIVITLVLSNEEDVALTGIRVEPLAVLPNELLVAVSGPTSESGTDPRVDPITLESGSSTSVTWVYQANEEGSGTLTANVSGQNAYTTGRFFTSDEDTIAIESAAFSITDFRLQPNRPVPGTFGTLRGTITNIGTVDVSRIDFELDSNPIVEALEGKLKTIDASISPRFDLLKVNESRDFLIPMMMVTEVEGLATYQIKLTMTGAAFIDGVEVDVVSNARTTGGLDLSDYWTTILGEVKSYLLEGFISLVDGVNDWGDSSTLGGINVGGGEGALNVLQKMGDGILKANDLLGEATGDGGDRLTEEGKTIVNAIREYASTTSPKKMLVDFADVRDDITIGAVDTLSQWMSDIDKAASAGDVREVSKLIAEPSTELLVGFGVEQGAGKLFSNIVKKAVPRKWLKSKKRAPDNPDVGGEKADYERRYAEDREDLRDLPVGVPLSGQTVARAGITPEEHAWMIETAKKYGVAFFVRPRPADAAKFARLGYNAKPMAIKLKSVNDIDVEWLGFDDFADSKGLVVLREPKDPYPALKKAINDGRFKGDEEELFDVVKRYHKKQAEWESRNEFLTELNKGDGFEVYRYGKKIKTKVTVDENGLLRFTHNNKPIYSDIDLLHIARPDGTPISPELHRGLSREGGFGFDRQHGDTMATSDFPNMEVAEKFVREYATEHKRGGDPLIIVQPDASTAGYVDTIDISPDVSGSNYELYGAVKVTYEGAGTR